MASPAAAAAPAAHGAPARGDIDTDLYSRQIYVLGLEAMQRMAGSNVLISGMTGLGVETAKNVILAGVKSVSIHDDTPVSARDLSSQFYLSSASLGQPRAAACLAALRELNQHVPVEQVEGALGEDVLARFQVVVLVNAPLRALQAAGAFCHSRGICFVATGTMGVMGYAFSDFGDRFTVVDADGEEPRTGVVVEVSRASPGVVQVAESTPHGLADGALVQFEGLEGMEELHALPPQPVKVLSQHTFSICDTSALSPHVRGGYFKQVKQPRDLRFLPLADSLLAPEFVASNYVDFDRPRKLLCLLQALWQHQESARGELPAPGDAAAAAAVATAAARLCGEAGIEVAEGSADMELLRRLAGAAAGDLNPMAAVFGGVVGQEVLKACTGKFTPLQQWLCMDFAECLPAHAPASADLAPTGGRYDGQVAVFGRAFQERLAAQRVFVVGAGALGCEFLKNLALMGVGTGASGGEVLVTDMDSIEKSNLNRQFLFRPWDVSKMKSTTAAAAASRMNPDLRLTAFVDKVAPDTEPKFNHAFWSGLSCVFNALDNVQARLYVDSKCVEFQKPLLESGTLGAKGHCQPIVPHATVSYASHTDPPEQSIPVCTLKTFPNQIEHTLQWARDLFEELFKANAEECNLYLTQPDYVAQLDAQRNLKLTRLRTLHEGLLRRRPASFRDCVALARLKFQDCFHDKILQLLHKFPADMVTGDPPKPFWSGARKPPAPLDFSEEDPVHMAFVVAAANLIARVYGIPGSTDPAVFRATLPGVEVPPFRPSAGVQIATTEEEAKELEKSAAALPDMDEQCERLLAELPPPAALGLARLRPEEFEKDDDANFHMDFVTACSNLRARNYRIPEADRLRSKQIAGRIIPAIATSTALTTGLVMLEYLKLVQREAAGEERSRDVSRFRSSNFNLAVNLFAFFEPAPAPAKSYKRGDGQEVTWTLWDCIDVDRDMTLCDLRRHLEERCGVEVLSLSSTGGHSVMLWSSLLSAQVVRERDAMTVSAAVRAVSGHAPSGPYVWLEVEAEAPESMDDDDDDFDGMGGIDDDADVELPPVRVRIT